MMSSGAWSWLGWATRKGTRQRGGAQGHRGVVGVAAHHRGHDSLSRATASSRPGESDQFERGGEPDQGEAEPGLGGVGMGQVADTLDEDRGPDRHGGNPGQDDE
jgi:hypothetical protein